MKSKAPRKKLLSDYSSQDELSMKRAVKSDLSHKRSKKPSIYDELDDDDLMNSYDDDDFDSYGNDDDLEEDDEE
jgi:hypothetical protein